MHRLEWRFRDGDDGTITAMGSSGIGYVITADLPPDCEEQSYTLHLPHGSYGGTNLVRLMLDAQEIEEHEARKVAA
jgi:hypothetical protein